MKLTDINKDTFAQRIADRVLGHHTQRLLFDVGPWAQIDGTQPDWRGTNIGRAAERLCSYAQTGEPPEPGVPVAEYLQTYCEALYTRPADGVSYDVPPLDRAQGEPQEEHEIVLVAAVARDLIDQGEHVSMAQLAVLAEVSHQWVRKMAHKGEIQTTGSRSAKERSVPADEARRWLAARGVEGFR